MFICSRALTVIPATTAPVIYIMTALKQFSVHTFQNDRSFFSDEKNATSTEFTKNSDSAITVNSQTKLVESLCCSTTSVGPSTNNATLAAINTEIAAKYVFIKIVLGPIATPRRRMFSDATVVSITASSRATSPP